MPPYMRRSLVAIVVFFVGFALVDVGVVLHDAGWIRWVALVLGGALVLASVVMLARTLAREQRRIEERDRRRSGG